MGSDTYVDAIVYDTGQDGWSVEDVQCSRCVRASPHPPMTMIRRRQLAAAVASLVAGVAGCGKAYSRGIEFKAVELNTTSQGTTITVKVRGNAMGISSSSSWAKLHDVRVVGYDKAANLLCEKSLGVVSPLETEQAVLRCETQPTYLSFVTEEGPCDSTQIAIWKFDSDENKYEWIAWKECGGRALQTPTE